MSTRSLRMIRARPHDREAAAILGQDSTVELDATAQEWLAAVDALSDTDRDYAARGHGEPSRAANRRWRPPSMTMQPMQ